MKEPIHARLVATDTSPLIASSRIGRFDLLPQVYEKIIAPVVVIEEFGEHPVWLGVREVAAPAVAASLRETLDAGPS